MKRIQWRIECNEEKLMKRSHAGQKRLNKSRHPGTHINILSQPTQNWFLPKQKQNKTSKMLKVHYLYATRYNNKTQDVAVMLKLTDRRIVLCWMIWNIR